MAKIPIDNFNIGGLADSKYSGTANSLAEMVALDIHSKPGIVRVHQKMTAETGTVPDEFVKVSRNVSNGFSVYLSADTGKIWTRSSSGTWALAHTTTPAAGEAKCLGAMQYQGIFYWATELRLHKITVSNIDGDWTGDVTEDFGTFLAGDKDFHPMFDMVASRTLFIGDGRYIAQVEDGTFSQNALDMKEPYRVKSLGTIFTDLLIGTFINDNVTKTELFRWNTWSLQPSASDPIPEIGINAFLQIDNAVLVSAGIFGNIYFYNGQDLEQFKRIPGDYSPTATSMIHPNAVENFLGMPLFGVSNRVGNPSKQGVFSLGRHSSSYPMVLNLDYPISEDNLSGVEIGTILGVGADLFITWKDTTGGTTYGVDKLDYSAKYASAYFETRVIKPEREFILTYKEFIANYEALPSGTSFSIFRKANEDSNFDKEIPTIKDVKHSAYVGRLKVDAARLQVKVTFGVSGNDAPELEDLLIIV